MLVAKNFVDIHVQNGDIDDLIDEDNSIKNDSSWLGGEYEVPSPLFRKLN